MFILSQKPQIRNNAGSKKDTGLIGIADGVN